MSSTIKTTLIIDGGLGRVITAIPALEAYVEKYPNTIIVVYGWLPIFFGNKKLIKNVFDYNHKGLLDLIKNTKIIKPEPYYNSDYISGKIHLIEAWNQEINGENEKLDKPKIYLTNDEIKNMSFIRDNYYTKIIAFQPFGSTAVITENDVIDKSKRSLDARISNYLVRLLRNQGYGLWLISDVRVPFFDRSDFINAGSMNIREVAGLLYHCDYFLGIDSSGQHMARTFDIPGSIIMGGTNSTNTTYPDHFNIVNDDPNKTYMPYRLGDFDWSLSEILNNDVFNISDSDLKLLGKNILKHIVKTTKNKKL